MTWKMKRKFQSFKPVEKLKNVVTKLFCNQMIIIKNWYFGDQKQSILNNSGSPAEWKASFMVALKIVSSNPGKIASRYWWFEKWKEKFSFKLVEKLNNVVTKLLQ